ncbi:MAG: prephenate dehydrogenase [Chloroflexota bacterium]|nr:MAG: prephenate dehydrogenase [Chloroflexota bacterium]
MARIAIVGLGIIGASFGLALKRAKLDKTEIVGHDVSYDAVVAARKARAVDTVDPSLARVVQGAGLVVLATPILTMREILGEIAGHLEPDCVVTDTGSTKRQVVSWAAELLPETVAFVGGHPMTGKDTAGVDGPDARLFDGRMYCLTPTETTPGDAVEAVTSLVHLLGAKTYYLGPDEHDALVAPASHLPLVISMALMTLVGRSSGWKDVSRLVAGGFRHVVINAGNNPRMSRDLAVTNAENVSSWIDLLVEELRGYQRTIATDEEETLRLFQDAFDAHREYLAGTLCSDAPPSAAPMPSLGQSFQQLFVGQGLLRRRGQRGAGDKEI